MVVNDNINKKTNKEIDMLGLFHKIISEKLLLIKFLVIFSLLGIIYALNTQKEYTATVVLAPEANSMGMSQNLNDIAGMVGLNIGGNNNSVDAIYPEIYPDVFTSSDFIIKLCDIPVKMKNGNVRKSYYNHIKNDNKIPFWDYPKIWLSKLFTKKKVKKHVEKDINPFQLTKEQNSICSIIKSNIGCQLNKGTNVITISVKDIDPVVAAILADTLQNRLQEYITLYRTKKARNDLAYAQKLNLEAKTEYVKARQIYGSYADANTEVILESYHAKQEDLENEMQLKYNNYTQTAQQVQLAKAKIQESTPAFTIIQRSSVPLKASSTPRSIMVLCFVILGFIVDSIWVLFIRDMLKSFYGKKKSK